MSTRQQHLTFFVVSLIFISTMLTVLLSQSLYADFWDNSVGLWLFDDGKGDIAKDSSGKGNDGKITGAKWVDGKFGKGLQIEPPQVVTIAPSDSLNLKDQITIAAWVNVGKGVSDTAIRRNGGYLLEMQSPSERVPGAFVFGIWSGGAFTGGVWGKAIAKSGEWHHVVGLYDSKEMQIYFDGVLEATAPQPGRKIDTPGDNLLLGTFGGEKFIGILDEVAFFNKGLSEKEIQTLTKGVEAAKAVEPSGKLAASWGRIKAKGSKL